MKLFKSSHFPFSVDLIPLNASKVNFKRRNQCSQLIEVILEIQQTSVQEIGLAVS